MNQKETLAAEYALGSLSTEDRAEAVRLLEAETDFADMVSDWEERLAPLAEAVEPIAPPARVWDAIEARITAEERVMPKGIVAAYNDEGEWRRLRDGVQIKSLYLDEQKQTECFLLKFARGGFLPAHDHGDWQDDCLVLEGDLTLNNNIHFGAGDFHVALPGITHPDLRSVEGCVLFVRSSRAVSGMVA